LTTIVCDLVQIGPNAWKRIGRATILTDLDGFGRKEVLFAYRWPGLDRIVCDLVQIGPNAWKRWIRQDLAYDWTDVGGL
jgi:hypothetical protein